MKKRILALALAGTTAFSVFGAAMSASAAGSSHVVFNNDKYVSYNAAVVTTKHNEGYVNAKGNFVTKEEYEKLPTTSDEYYAANAAAILKEMNYSKVTTTVYEHVIAEEGTVLDNYYSIYNVPESKFDTVTVATYGTPFWTKGEESGEVYADADVLKEAKAYTAANKAGELKGAYKPADNGTIIVTGNGDGLLVTDDLSRNGITVENGNVYAYDYFTNYAEVADFANQWDAANFVRGEGVWTSTSVNNVALMNTIEKIGGKFVTGKGGYNSSRLDVIEEYENFLYDLGLMDYNGYTLEVVKANVDAADEAAFLTAYNYKYNGRDEYNFEGLVHDIFESARVNALKNDNTETSAYYTKLSSSNLVYIMQQYDKYVDGSYISGVTEDIGDNAWANLLISALEAVTEDDFKGGYSTFDAKRTKAIAAYEKAASVAAQNAAIKDLYDLVVSSNGRSAGADKANLNSELNSLYFNNKNLPTTYLALAETSEYADLVLYGYKDAQKVIDASVKPTDTYAKAVYPLYPAPDYYEYDNGVATYIGNTGKYGLEATDAYEWFVNVYELAAKVNKMNEKGTYQGIVDTLTAALEDAVADLAVTKTPAGSTSMRLEEAVEAYDGKIESDYGVKYYGAFEEANDFADVAEGNLQTKYAIEMVIVSGETLGYQSAQSTITKGDIKELKAAIADAENAAKALKADKENYNAAQYFALTGAIDGAQYIVDVYNGVKDSKVNKTTTKTAGDKDAILRSDVEAAMNAIDAAINYKNVIQGWSKNSDGKWMYGKDDKYLADGWNKVGSVWYYFNEDGTAKQSEWYKEGNTWYYFNSNAGAARGWCKVDGEWYYFNDGCAMVTGWRKVDGNWYYLAASGKMTTGWVQVGGKWYYMSKESNSLGQMLANTTVEGYKLGADGAMIEK